jgi:glutathione synthase/RimK-type ligase-like ATP-grasp enzyme
MIVRFATSTDYPDLTADDLVAARALAERGVRVEALVWTADAPPTSADAVVIRSCWDYHLREAAFRSWLDTLEAAGTLVLNPPALVRWNLHKSYMADLAARDVPVVPTVHTRASDPRNLADIMGAEGWTSAVVKPAVSLSAYETWRVDAPPPAAAAERFTALRARSDVLVQRYVPEVTTAGEWSLVFFGHTFSHAVRKLPRDGDFRVQTEHGGSVILEHPPAAVLDAAAHALANLPAAPAYCRIDGVSADGRLLLMEAECIDPVLFFTEHPAAAGAFADEIVTRIGLARTSRDDSLPLATDCAMPAR